MTENADVQDIDDGASVDMSNVTVSYDFRFQVDRETFDSYVSDSQVPKNVAEEVACRIVQDRHRQRFNVVGSARVVVDQLDMSSSTVYVSGIVKQ
jgi:hypothetical protein